MMSLQVVGVCGVQGCGGPGSILGPRGIGKG